MKNKPRGLRESLSAFAQGGVLAMVRLGTGFGRTKYIALALGPFGVGVLSQANQLNLLTISLGSLSMATGIINGLALATTAQDEPRAKRILGTAFAVQFVLSALITAFGLIFSSSVSRIIYDADQPLWSTAIIAGAPLAVGASGFLEGVLFGTNRYDLYLRASLTASILGVAAQIALIHWFGLRGAFIGFPVNSAILFICFTLSAQKCRPLRNTFVLAWDIRELVPLLKFSGSVLINSTFAYAVTIVVRRMVLGTLGANANGLLQVPVALSAYYTPFVTNGLYGRLHPFVSARGDSVDSRNELGRAIQIASALTLAYVVSVVTLRPILVSLAYSSAFTDCLPLMPFQAAGDYAYFITFTMGVYLLGTRGIRAYVLGWGTYYLLLVSFAFLLIPRLQLRGVPVAHLIAAVVSAMLGLFFFRMSKRLSNRTIATVGIGGLLAGAECWAGAIENLPAQIGVAMASLILVMCWWFRWNADNHAKNERTESTT